MNRWRIYALTAVLAILCATGALAAGNGGTGPSIENIPVVVMEPLPPVENPEIYTHRADLPVAAGLQERSEGDSVLFDALILRPAGIVACALGLAASAVALPFSLLSGTEDRIAKSLIADPFAYTFVRPLGANEPVLPPAPR